MEDYRPAAFEKKWTDVWEKEKTFKVDVKKAKRPFYNLMMFPYPSGEGLHVGHVYAFGGSDTFGRFKRAQGYDVFEPMGFDSFGIHSENYALKVGKHPKALIEETTAYFRGHQLKRLGALFDWERQVITSDPSYYKWTQWLFIQLFKAGLAVRKKAAVDWCPSCKTVLADEQVIAGRCERCNSEVIQKQLEQWFFKITKYADRLLKNLEWIDWSETTKAMQRNWIGRSEGTMIKFKIEGDYIEVFTTRPDTIYGATFLVLAPEHPLATKIATAKNREAVDQYLEESKKITELERTQTKTGVFTGAYAVNPFTKKEIPVWVADYVLMGYGTGAIMAVPAHDSRDYDFAKEHDLRIVEVIAGGDISREAYLGEGKLVNSGEFTALPSKEAIIKIADHIEDKRHGKKTVTYHLRDWLISRQRYWGPPIPMIYCQNCAKEKKSWFTTREAQEKIQNSESRTQNSEAMRGWYPVLEKDLPVGLPYVENYRPRGTGVGPLASLPSFIRVVCPECGKVARRETDVSDTFLDSSWYFLRYPSVGFDHAEVARQQFNSASNPRDNDSYKFREESALVTRKPNKLIKFPALQTPWDPQITKKWLPVDMYIGGNEHAVLHLLYTRFITMALHDIGLIDFEEPFRRFRAHGLIIRGGAKMSKSRGNVVNPNEYMDAYGSDTLRMYLLFIGPYDQGGDFSDRAITGVYRFLNRVWKTVLEISSKRSAPDKDFVARQINKLVKKVGNDVADLKFNTAIAALMEFLNFMVKNTTVIDSETIKKYLIILAIFAPFTAEELWERAGFRKYLRSVHKQGWPGVEEVYLEEEKLNVVVQIDGKVRDTVEIKKEELRKRDLVENKALALEKIKRYLTGKRVEKTIYVPGKIINFVTQ